MEQNEVKKTKQNTYIGSYNDYSFCYLISPYTSNNARINAYLKEKVDLISDFLNMNRARLKIKSYSINDFSINLVVISGTNTSYIKNLENALSEITSYMKSIEVPSNDFCPICGESLKEDEMIVSEIDHLPIIVDKKCVEEINKIEQLKIDEFNLTPNNYGKGILGALIGCGIGFIVWLIIGVCGFISWWVALLIPFAGSYFYDLLGGKRTSKKIIIVDSISLIAVLLGTFSVYLIIVGQQVSENHIDMNVFEALIYLLENDKEFLLGFIKDISISLVFGVAEIIALSIVMKKQIGTYFTRKK